MHFLPNLLKNMAIMAFCLTLPLATGLTPAYAADLPIFTNFTRIDTRVWYLSHGWSNGEHQSCEWRRENLRINDGRLSLVMNNKGGQVRSLGCAEIQSHKRVGHGRFEARFRTAPGSGLNSGFFSYIGPPVGVPDHDEIDFEILGRAPDKVEITHWVKGQKYPGGVFDLGFDSSKGFHTYAYEWSPDQIVWFVDGKEIYRTPPGVPLPTNPQKIFFSLWSGSKISDDWLGPYNYDRPATMEVVYMKYTPAPKP